MVSPTKDARKSSRNPKTLVNLPLEESFQIFPVGLRELEEPVVYICT
jgi:hypothetical protein